MISSSILILLVIMLVIINAILWGIEAILATLRWIYNWVENKHPKKREWYIYFISIRIVFTRILNKVLFAVASNTEIKKYQLIKQNKSKQEIKQHFHKNRQNTFNNIKKHMHKQS